MSQFDHVMHHEVDAPVGTHLGLSSLLFDRQRTANPFLALDLEMPAGVRTADDVTTPDDPERLPGAIQEYLGVI